MTNEALQENSTVPFYLKYKEKANKQLLVNILAILSLIIVSVILLALSVFQFFYAERASQYFGLTEFEYLHFFNFTFTTAQLPAFGVAGGLIVISVLNAFRYESYYSKNPSSVISKENNPFLFNFNRLLPVEWALNIFKGFLGYIPNDVTWLPKLLFALIEGCFIYVALSVEKASNPVVHQLGLMVAIGLPVLSYVTSHGFAWLFFYVFDYNSYRSKLLNEDNTTLQKKNIEIQETVKNLEKERLELELAIGSAKSKLDDLINDLARTDDDVERLKAQKTDLIQQMGSIANGNHPLELENQIRQLKEDNQHLKKVIEMNLKYIETALTNTRDSIGFTLTIDSNEKDYHINDSEFLEAEKEMAAAGFAPTNNKKKASRT